MFAPTKDRLLIKKSCGDQHGLNLIAEFKTQLNAYKLPLKIRTQKSGCLGICQFGPTIAIYPEGIFYVGVQLQDVKEIVESHIINKNNSRAFSFKSWKLIFEI